MLSIKCSCILIIVIVNPQLIMYRSNGLLYILLFKMHGHSPVVEMLINLGADINAVTNVSYLFDYYSYSYVANIDSQLAIYLLNKLVFYLQNGDTALHFASHEGNYSIVELLTKAGANVTIINKVSHPYISYVAIYSYSCVYSYLHISLSGCHSLDLQLAA